MATLADYIGGSTALTPPEAPAATARNPVEGFLRRAAVGAAGIPTAPLGLYVLGDYGLRYARGNMNGQVLPGAAAGMRALQSYDQTVRNALGVPAPADWTDVAQEAAGNAVTGGLLGMAGRAAGYAPNLALRSVFVVPRSPVGMAVDTAAQTAIGTALLPEQSANAQPAPVAQTASPQAQPTPSASPALPTEQPQSLLQFLQGSNGSLGSLQSPETASEDAGGWKDIWLPLAAAAGGTALTLGLARAAMRGGSLRANPSEGRVITGVNEPTGSDLTRMERLVSRVFNQNEAITGPVQRGVGGAVADVTRNAVALDLTPQAVTQRFRHAWETGDYEGLLRSRTPARAYTESYTRIAPEQRTLLDDYLGALNEQDNRYRGITSNQLTPQELAAIVQRGAADPVVSRLAGEFRQITNDVLRYAHVRGLLDANTFQEWTTNRPNYYPQIRQTRDSLWRRLVDAAPTDVEKKALTDVQFFLQRAQTTEGLLAPSPQALEAYMSAIMRVANMNHARATALGALETVTNGPLAGAVRRVRGSTPASEQTLTVMRQGREVRYAIRDPEVFAALRAMPHNLGMLGDVANAMRRTRQFGATGPVNPSFAPSGLLYEALTSSLTAPKGTRFGLLPGDPISGIALSVLGSGRGLYGGLTRQLSQAFLDSWRNEGVISHILGPTATRWLADNMAAAYERSTLGAMSRTGALSAGRFSADPSVRNVHSMLDITNVNYASRFPELRKAWESYRGILELVQAGARLHYFALNSGRFAPGSLGRMLQPRNAPDERTLARYTRELAGDPSIRGSAKTTQSLNATIPYMNVALQEFARLGQAIRQQPASFGFRLATTIGLPTLFAAYQAHLLGGDYLDHFYRRRTPEQRNSQLPIYTAGTPADLAPTFHVPPTMRPLVALVQEGARALMAPHEDLQDPNHPWHNIFRDDFTSAVLGAQPITMPPIADTGLALGGVDFRMGYGAGLGQIVPLRGERLTGDQGMSVVLPPNASALERTAGTVIAQQVASSILATAGTMWLEAVRAGFMAERGGRSPWGEAAEAAAIRQQRGAPELRTVLWNMPARLSVANSDWQELNSKLRGMESIANTLSESVRQAGYVGSSRNPQRSDALLGNTGIADTRMIPMLGLIAAFQSQIARLDLTDLRRLQDNVDAAGSNIQRRPGEREVDRNYAVRDLMERQRILLTRVRDFEQRLSRQFNRQIDLSRIDRRTTWDSLRPLN